MRYFDTASKCMMVIWCVAALAGLAFWGSVLYIGFKTAQHFGIL